MAQLPIAPPPLNERDTLPPDVDASTHETGATPIFQRILLPIDFSEASRRALVTAVDLARRYGSELHTVNIASFGQNSEFLAGLGAPTSRDDVIREACAHVDDYVRMVVPDAPRVASCTVEMDDDVVGGIVRAAERTRATCIVMGVHAHARKPLLRTRVEKVSLAVGCPVLIVKAPPEPVINYD